MHENMQEVKDSLREIRDFMKTIVDQNDSVMSQIIDSKLGVIPREFMRVETHEQIMRTTQKGYVMIFLVALGVANIKEISPFVVRLFSSATSLVDSSWGETL